MRAPALFWAFFLALGCAACTPFPDLGDRGAEASARAAPFPVLVPLEPVLEASADIRITEDTSPALNARAAALRARAALLRRQVGP
ncbi:hypothetical protein [Thalassovita taeanensis]|uniref:Uncharacterized protein n=1 Tax=Thalassovita taeanensis TaxID=657014 RepID=A0A1H9JUF9_9RHOB|nr:hypothetical protein [Thalassovita taeanensis]SEQ90427.1 hypothetical protein SAMN04488092_11633 [Thalassovita taeanensis]